MVNVSEAQRRKELDREMSSYLDSIKKRRFSMDFFRQKKKDFETPLEKYGKNSNESMFESLSRFISGIFGEGRKEPEEEFIDGDGGESAEEEPIETEPTEEFEEHAEVSKKGGVLEWVKSLFSSGEKEEYPELEETEPETMQDLKTIANSVKGMIEKLPSEEIKKIKESEEFAKFKEVLQKNKVIK